MEPWVTLEMEEGKPSNLLAAARVCRPKEECNTERVSGKGDRKRLLEPPPCEAGSHELTHSFLCVSECPTPLLGKKTANQIGCYCVFKSRIEVGAQKTQGAEFPAFLQEVHKDPETIPEGTLALINQKHGPRAGAANIPSVRMILTRTEC